MTYKTRIGILAFFVGLFLIVTPVVVLYTAGYRWNLKKARFEKIGIIFVGSRPAGANIYLDGKLRKEKTPARLRNLLPDSYEITVSKAGYYSWSKKLAVESGLAAFADQVTLWKNAAPERIDALPSEALTAEEQAQMTRIDPLSFELDGTSFRSDGFEIWTEEAERGKRDTVTRLSEEITAILPHPSGGWIFYAKKDSIHAIERDGRDRRNDVLIATGADIAGMAISPDGKMLYYEDRSADGKLTLYRRQLQ